MGGLTGRAGVHVLVELVGLPGSGKTHVARALVEALADRGAIAAPGPADVGPQVRTTRRIGRKLLLVGEQGLAHPVSSTRAALGVAVGQRGAGDAASRAVQWLVTQRLFERARHDGGLHVFEEGTLQALWSIGLRARHDAWLRFLRLLDHGLAWEEPEVVVVVEAPVDVVRARLQDRASRHSRTQGLAEAEMTAELRRGRLLLDELVAWWRARRGTEALLRVDNAETPSGLGEVAARILQPGDPAPASQADGPRGAAPSRTGIPYRRSSG